MEYNETLKLLNSYQGMYLGPDQDAEVDGLLRAHPDIWREYAGLVDWTRNAALEIIHRNTLQYKCIVHGIVELREELVDANDTRLEKLLIDSIVTNHLVNEKTGFKLETLPEEKEGDLIARHRVKVHDRSHDRMLRSVNLLTRVRNARLDYVLKVRKNRPKFYDRDDYLRVSEDVINKREDEVIIEEALNNAARWEEKSQRMEQQKIDIRAAKEKAKLIEAFVDDAEPGNTNHAIAEFLKTHEVDEEGLVLLETAQKVIDQKRGPRAPEPITYPIVEFLKTKDLDEEGSAILAVAQHLIDKRNPVALICEARNERSLSVLNLGKEGQTPGKGTETGSPGHEQSCEATRFPGPGFEPDSQGRGPEDGSPGVPPGFRPERRRTPGRGTAAGSTGRPGVPPGAVDAGPVGQSSTVVRSR